MVQKIKWAILALDDLRNIYEYIAKDSRRYAQIQVENIQNAVSNLANFPLMGHKIPEFPHLPHREISVGSYRIIYRFEEKESQILVMSVIHGRRVLKWPLSEVD